MNRAALGHRLAGAVVLPLVALVALVVPALAQAPQPAREAAAPEAAPEAAPVSAVQSAPVPPAAAAARPAPGSADLRGIAPDPADAGEPGAAAEPVLTSRVVDQADILPPDAEARLEARARAFEEQTTDQIVVVTLASLDGRTIEDVGYELGQRWGIGQGRADNGVLLIIAPNDRQMRIEVGQGVEGVLPDIIAGQIIRNEIVPRFRDGDMAGGIEAGVAAIETALLASPEDVAQRIRDSEQAGSSDGLPFELVVFIILVIIIVVAMSNSGGGRRGRFRRASSGLGTGPVIVHDWGSSGWSSGGSDFGGGGGFSGGGGSFGGGGASGSW